MKKLILLPLLLLALFVKSQTITDSATLRSYINSIIIPNGSKSITGAQMNAVLNGIASLMVQYSFNSAVRNVDTLTLSGPNVAPIKITISSASTYLKTNPSTLRDTTHEAILFTLINGATTTQQKPIIFNFRTADTSQVSQFYYPLTFNGLPGTSKSTFAIKSETNRLALQTGPDDVLSIGYGLDGLDSGRYIRIGIESNFRQPGQPDSARQFEFHMPEIGYTSPGNVHSGYRPASWIGSRTHPSGSWMFHADSYTFSQAGSDNPIIAGDANNITFQTAGDGHLLFRNMASGVGLDLSLTGSGTVLNINSPANIVYGGTFAIASVVGTNYYPASGGNTIQLNSFTNDLFVKGYANTFTNEMSQNTGEWSWNIPATGGYFYKWSFGGTPKLTMTPTVSTFANQVTLNANAVYNDPSNVTYIHAAPNSGYIFQRVQPANYNASQNQSFLSWVDDTNDNNEQRHDVVGQFWGYNMGPGSAKLASNEPAFGFKTENYYRADGTSLMEFHLPEMVDSFGTYHRLFSMYTHRLSGYTYLQSQIGSLSFRHHWDNSGSTDWFNVGSGDGEGSGHGTGTAGAAQMTLSSVGALTGSFVRATFFDADGGFLQLISVGGAQNIRGSLDMTLTPGRFLNMPLNINFNQTDYFSDGTVALTGPDNTVNHGFQFYSLDGSNLAWLSKGLNLFWQPTRVVGNAEVDGRLGVANAGVIPTTGAYQQFGAAGTTGAQINFNPASAADPTTANNGDLWYASNHVKFQDGGVTYELPRTLTATATLDFPSTTSTTVSDLTITVTGAAVGDAVAIGVPNGSVTATASFIGWVSSANTVKIRFSPKATEDPASGTYKVTIIK